MFIIIIIRFKILMLEKTVCCQISQSVVMQHAGNWHRKQEISESRSKLFPGQMESNICVLKKVLYLSKNIFTLKKGLNLFLKMISLMVNFSNDNVFRKLKGQMKNTLKSSWFSQCCLNLYRSSGRHWRNALKFQGQILILSSVSWTEPQLLIFKSSQ